ncbi:hypothetical protein OG555_12805 [Kribbella sp. NBC_01484]|uniref:hypothetical protein n=1 Tax=Kribbella sp. NBC_01484 TaxID=2903579 RepID=UPI002E333676|nr:hypothetical protein [Kribbella sp. NBC_01484]
MERRRLSRAERLLEGRPCSRCSAWSEPAATHCAGCRRRFTAAEDATWRSAAGSASATIGEAEEVLADLARGVLLERIGGRGTERTMSMTVSRG